MPETLYILDGHSQIYRAYYAPFRDLTSPAGEPTRATYVFCSMLLKFIAHRAPKYLAMAIDGPAEKLHRRKLYPDYKITRKPMPDDLPPQVQRIVQIVRAMGICVLQKEGYEADDILATAAERFASPQMQVVLISRDKDLFQVVADHVVLYDPMKDEQLDAAAIAAAKGYTPAQAVDIQTLAGDSIDNIPGIAGVGPKTAVRLIAQYGSLEAVLQHADEQTPKLRKNLLAGAETIPLTKKLVTLDRNVPIDLRLEELQFSGLAGEALRPIFAELGFNRLLDQLDQMGIAGREESSTASISVPRGQTTAADFDYRCIDTPESLTKLLGELKDVKRLGLDTETTSTQPMWAELVGLSLAWQPGKAVYLPVKAPLGEKVLDVELLRETLGPILSDPTVLKIGQNLKYDLIVLGRAGFATAGPFFDTMIAAHVLDSSRMTYKLDALAMEILNHRCIPITDLLGRGRNQTTMNAVPIAAVTTYAAEDADVTFRLAEVLTKQLADEKLDALFENLEMPLMPVLAEMEQYGIVVDPEALKQMEQELSQQADALRHRIVTLAGRPFNVDSPKQLAEVLFDDLKLPVIKRTKTGPSTDAGVLSELAIEHELPALMLEYRKLTKLLSTYLTALAQCIHPRTRRVHTSFHQAATVTGRLSSSDPNLQNIPIRSPEGRKIRSAFVADEGHLLLSADYSQVELRMLAHLCQDPTLCQAFSDDQDIHRIVAAEVFGVPLEKVTPQQRDRAKGVNFGIIYGQTAFGLSRSLRIARNEAAKFIQAYKKRFPKIQEFLAACIEQAKASGYVETIFGRRRRIVDIEARNPQRRAMAERLAINSVVQGSAADLIKQAMVNLAARIRNEHRPSRMLLQIHDELVFEVPGEAIQKESAMITEEMTGAIRLCVPLKVDVGIAANWMDAK